MEYALKSEAASKGVAGAGLGTGIAGLSLGVLNTICSLWSQNHHPQAREVARENGLDFMAILPLIMSHCNGSRNVAPEFQAIYESKESAMLRQENATLRASQETDQKLVDVYSVLRGELKERDAVTTGTLIEAARNEERIKCLSGKVDKLEVASAIHTQELSNISRNEAVTHERLTALAHNTKQSFEAQAKEFWCAINSERDQRISADKAIYGWTEANFVRNKKVVPIENLSEKVVAATDVMSYFAAGNDDPTPVATSGQCCPQTMSD